MMEINYLPVDKSNIKKQPDRFVINISDKDLIFEFSYNPEGDFFTFNLYDQAGEPIIYGRRLVYGVNMLDNVVDNRIPEGIKIIPMDKTGTAEKIGINYDNFMDEVKPYIVGGN